VGRTLVANKLLAGSACGKRLRGRPLNSVVSRHLETSVTELSDAAKKQLEKLHAHMTYIDESALIILKGHLIVEEALGEVISRFVHHSEYLEGSRLTFAQKLAIARTMSLDDHVHEMWPMVTAINSLRNSLAHSLDSPKRAERTKALMDLYFKQGGVVPKLKNGKDAPEAAALSMAFAMCLGFLASAIEEVKRFRSMVESMDKVANPHRHK
jgi:hypothetical protein